MQAGGGDQGLPLTRGPLRQTAIPVKRGFALGSLSRSSSVRLSSLTDTAFKVGGEFIAVPQMRLGFKSFVP